jgi:hypothetical protein
MSGIVHLEGSARQRGAGQAAACPDMRDAVQAAVSQRLRQAGETLGKPGARNYLEAQRRFTASHDPDALDELAGIAEGFGIDASDLFAYLHLAILGDMEEQDGCSAWAIRHPEHGALVGKNRDFRGEHLGLQRVFRLEDPAWGGRSITCIGSLGSPGAYSSGINSDGLALVDTQVHTSDHGIGLLRYFLMTRLLARCRTVPDALAELLRLDHAGGGTLVLADAGGRMAAVELGHTAVAIDQRETGWVARTNHFTMPPLDDTNLARAADPMAASSRARLDLLTGALRRMQSPWSPGEARRIVSSHDADGVTGLCRHGQDGDARTISAVVFATGGKSVYFCLGSPCTAEWLAIDAR